MQHESSFFGGVFSDSIEGGRAGADIDLSIDRVTATTKDGQQFLLRYSDCHVDIGGFNNRMVFCRNADRSLTIFCEDKRFADALIHASGGLLEEALQDKRKQLKSQSRQGSSWMLVGLILVAALIVGVYFGVRAAGVAAVKAVPTSVDKEIGTQGFKSMDLGGKEIHDDVVVGAIREMVDRLAPHAAIPDMTFEVHVIDSPDVNAFALPGGIIVVFTGLIRESDQPEQVAGVLAHEMSHATLRHGLQRISQSLGIAAAANLLLGDMQGLMVLGSELFQLATINSYSREQESNADSEGVRMLHAAAIDPLGLAQFFEKLKEQGNGLPGGLAWISTHPDHDQRIMNVRSQLASLPTIKYRPLEVDWDEVLKRVGNE